MNCLSLQGGWILKGMVLCVGVLNKFFFSVRRHFLTHVEYIKVFLN